MRRRCWCSRDQREPCERCQRRLEALEARLEDPESQVDYEERVEGLERDYERYLDRIGGSA